MPNTDLFQHVREFIAEDHIRNILEGGEWVSLRDENDHVLPGIRGRVGVEAVTAEGYAIGCDLVAMDAGSQFPLHMHPGDHILYVLEGPGILHVDGTDQMMNTGDLVFIPGEYAHGVKTLQASPLTFLAFGHPHKHIGATDRMKLVYDNSH